MLVPGRLNAAFLDRDLDVFHTQIEPAMPDPDHIQDHTESQEVLAARTGQTDIFGKLDDELPALRINGDAIIELERRWRAAGCQNASEYRRMVLYANLFGEEHVANLQVAKLRRVIGNAGALPRKVEAERA